jgi:hypothetical protein
MDVFSQDEKNAATESGLPDLHLAMDAELLDAFPQRGSRDAEQFSSVNLVVGGFLECFDDQLAFHGWKHFQLGITLGDLEQLPRERGSIGGGTFTDSGGRGDI